MNTKNLRLKTKNDIIPSVKEGQSWYKWFEENNGERQCVYGSIGYSGTKVHRFVASYLIINGENVIVSLSSMCGSQSYGSGLGVNLDYTEEQVTCGKCKPKN
jgi:hypothetical protein